MEFKYQLQKYTGRSSRHVCPQCGKRSFTLYVDSAGEAINEIVGRCDHESNCGYHLTPKQYFETHPTEKDRFSFDVFSKKQPLPTKIDHIPFDLILRSQSLNNTLMDYLKKYWSEKELQEVTIMYHLGCTKKREIIFPQISMVGLCHTGKVMQYDKDGHRIKKEFDCVDWLHSRLMRAQGKQSSDFHLKQVLFGEHLLSKRKDAMVAITESEKSAVICALTFPSIVWVSCGGKNGLSLERCNILKNRNVMLYPDADAVDLWSAKAEDLKSICKSVRVSNWWKSEPEGSKRDVADLILAEKLKQQSESTTIGQLCQWLHEMGIKPGSVIINV
ncbi:hypothetical protein EVA_06200 [gut metagenome]|uniref:Uncharacterized protein n=1 Tax=gut metagenome TaxID=749906 RepID=J9GED0_9ZZZZ